MNVGHGNHDCDEALSPHALRVLERRNEAFRILYDTVVKVEGAGEEQVYDILCENLCRLCQARSTTLASYDSHSRALVLESLFVSGPDGPRRIEIPSDRSMALTQELHAQMLNGEIVPCKESQLCLYKLVGDDIKEHLCEDQQCRGSIVQCVRNGELIALGFVRTGPDERLPNRDIVEIFLSQASMVLQRVRAIQQLRQSELWYRTLIEATDTGYVVLDRDGRMLDGNDHYARLTGHESLEEVLGRSVLDWTAPADRQATREAIAECLRKGSLSHFQTNYCNGVGANVPVELSAGRVLLGGRDCILGLCSNNTQRKVMEAQLAQAQKLEAIGQLASGIAHEINTPTQYVGDNLRFIGESLSDLLKIVREQHEYLRAAAEDGKEDPKLTEILEMFERADIDYLFKEIPPALEQSLEGVGRVTRIVAAMKEFSHPGIDERMEVDINRALESTITVCRNEWKYHCELETRFDPSLPKVYCQAGEINQALLNIIVNAAHAIREVVGPEEQNKGTIVIETRDVGRWAEIRISDTGGGIPEEIGEQIFNPFFTTKEVGKGTGQGLAIARSAIVDKHHGTLSFQSEPGEGTTFVIRLPYEVDPSPSNPQVQESEYAR